MMNIENQHMNNYTDINPYQLIYCNMNIRVNQAITKESAENVVRQIGYLHNAIGYVFKDLIKILAYKFPQNATPEMQPFNNRTSPYVNRPQPNNKHSMDIEFQSEPEPKNSEVGKGLKGKQRGHNEQKQRIASGVFGEQIEQVCNLNRQQKPPNTNIFDQYAYSKQNPVQIPKNKDSSSIKLGVARIIEGVKKKKGAESKDKIQKQPIFQMKIKNNNDYLFSDRTERKNSHSEVNPLSQILDKPIQENKQGDIFSEFIYKNKPSPISKPPQLMQSSQTNVVQRNEQQDENRLWQFLKQKQQPPIYEISDDED